MTNGTTSSFGTLESGAILVGHSVGGTILLGVLAAQSAVQEFSALFLLAAPFIGDGGWPSAPTQDRRAPTVS